MGTLLLVAWLAAAPSRLSGDSYIVALKDSVAAEDVARTAADLVGRHGGVLEHVYREENFKGFSARLPPVAASGIRRDARVASVDALAAPEPPSSAAKDPAPTVEPPSPSRLADTPRERLPFAPGFRPKFRRVVSPEADRYVVVLADSVTPDGADRVADELIARHGGARGPVADRSFIVQTSETAARAVSRDPRVDFVEEQSIASPAGAQDARSDPRWLPGQRLRRVAQPQRNHYRFVLRPNVPDERNDETVAELLRAYEGRRAGDSEDPRVVFVEMSEPSALALSDDLRVELVEEQPTGYRAGRR